MKARCCRSTPRCSGCPVLVKARASTVTTQSPTAALIAEILAGRRARMLPASIEHALERLDAARPGHPSVRARA